MRIPALHAFAAILLAAPLPLSSELLLVQPESTIWVEGTRSSRPGGS